MKRGHHSPSDIFAQFATCVSETITNMAADFRRQELNRISQSSVIATRGKKSSNNFDLVRGSNLRRLARELYELRRGQK